MKEPYIISPNQLDKIPTLSTGLEMNEYSRESILEYLIEKADELRRGVFICGEEKTACNPMQAEIVMDKENKHLFFIVQGDIPWPQDAVKWVSYLTELGKNARKIDEWEKENLWYPTVGDL